MRSVIAFSAVSATVAVSQAAIVVSFGGTDLTTGNLSGNSGGTTSAVDRNGDGLNDALRRQVWASLARNGSIATSEKFYGTYELIELSNGLTAAPAPGATAPNVDDWKVDNDAAGDRIHVRTQISGAGTGNPAYGGSQTGAFYWNQADFKTLTTEDLQLNSLTSQLADKAPETRWLVQNNGTWYVSNVTLAANTVNTLLDPDDTTWAVYDYTTDRNFNQSAATFSAQTFNKLQSVGLYYEQDTQPSGAQRLKIVTFVADAQVPEPATLASLALAGLVGLRRRR